MTHGINSNLLVRAQEVFPGASLGSFVLPETLGFVVTSGKGARLRDERGREYLDYVLGSGPMILGHAHPSVVAAVRSQLELGSTYYVLNETAVQLAEEIIAATGWTEMLKFCGSGSEATFYALRLARAATGRNKILKFEGGYHGHHDYALMSTTPARTEPFPTPVPDTAGIPSVLRDEVLIAPFNDIEATIRILDDNIGEIAAVLIEPECRMIAPKLDFLEGLREATRSRGIFLIFDEVVTGFRAAYGGARALYNVTPDLICYGKIIGGGYPLACVAGRREVMQLSNPRNKGPNYVYFSGTLNGNPLAAAAGLATLKELQATGTYERLNATGERMRKGLAEIAARLNLPAQVLGVGPTANIYFTAKEIYDYRSAQTEDKQLKQRLGEKLLRRGILTNLTQKLYISTVHTDADVDMTLSAMEASLREIVDENAAQAFDSR